MSGKACSHYLLIWVNFLAFAISLAIVGVTLNMMYGTNNLSLAFLSGLPVQLYYILIGFAGLVFLISSLGMVGGCMHSKTLTVLFVVFDLISLLAVIVVCVFVLLYANGIPTIPLFDNAATTLETTLESVMISEATSSDSAVWVTAQTKIGCCGIDFETTYNFSQYSLNDTAFQAELESGPNCAAGRAEIASLHQTYPTYSSDAQSAASAATALEGYFCKEVLITWVHTNTMVVGIGAGVLVLVQLVSLVAAFRLLCKVYTTQGGYVVAPESTGGAISFNGGPQTNGYSGNTFA